MKRLKKIINYDIDKIVRSNRRSIGLQINKYGKLIIRVPYGFKEENIINMILKHKKWIDRKTEEIKKRNLNFKRKTFTEGENFFYLGTSFPLKVTNNQNKPLIFNGECFFLKNNIKTPKSVFIDWYKTKGYPIIKKRVEFYYRISGLSYKNIKITSAMKRWGSCSAKGNLNFSWRLIMAPIDIIDYVVVHEIVHLKEKNHKKSFWNKVSELYPNYKEAENWLKKNGYLLNL